MQWSVGLSVLTGSHHYACVPFQKCLNVLQQVTSRGRQPITICSEADLESQSMMVGAGNKHTIIVPNTVDCLQGILNAIPMQLLAYHIARYRGLSVDTVGNQMKDSPESPFTSPAK